MNLELSKAIKDKSRIRNKYNKWRSRENYIEWQNIKKKCKYLTKKAEKQFFENILSKGIITNKEFWQKIKPALSDKNSKFQTDIILKEGDNLINEDNEISHTLNNQYVDIVEISTGNAPQTLGVVDISNKESMLNYINTIISHYNHHPSIRIIKEQTQYVNQTKF